MAASIGGGWFAAVLVPNALVEITPPPEARVRTTTDSEGRYRLSVGVPTFKLRVAMGRRDQNWNFLAALGDKPGVERAVPASL